jgi:hypothetical protein
MAIECGSQLMLSFESFAIKAGIEFFSIGGDPNKLIAYIVKN